MEGKRAHETEPWPTSGKAKDLNSEDRPVLSGSSTPGVGIFEEVMKSPEGRPNIEVTFVYVVHTLEHIDEVWEKIKDTDIVLLESVGLTKEKRESDLLLYNVFLNIARENPNDPAVRRAIKNCRDSDSFAGRLVGKILEEGGGKKIGYVDVSEEEPTCRESKEALELDAQIRVLARGGKIREAREVLPKFVKALAASSAKREDFVASQLKERFKEVEGKKKITVIQGASHTSTCHAIKREGLFPTHSAFVPQPHTLSPVETLVWRKKFFPEEEITEEEYDRALIGNYLIIPGAQRIWPKAQIPELDIFTNRLARRLGTKEISDIFERFAETHKGKGKTSPIPVGDLPKLRKKMREEFQTNCSKIVKALAEKHGVTIKRAPRKAKTQNKASQP